VESFHGSFVHELCEPGSFSVVYDYLYGNGNKRCRLQQYGDGDSDGEPDADGIGIGHDLDLRGWIYDFDGDWCEQLFLESCDGTFGYDRICADGESFGYDYLHGSGHERSRLYG